MIHNYSLSVLNVKELVGAFNQEKALVGAFSMIVQLHRLIVYSTNLDNHFTADCRRVVHCSTACRGRLCTADTR